MRRLPIPGISRYNHETILYFAFTAFSHRLRRCPGGDVGADAPDAHDRSPGSYRDKPPRHHDAPRPDSGTSGFHDDRGAGRPAVSGALQRRIRVDGHPGLYHLGGFVLFGEDFEGQTPDSLRQTLSGYQSAARIPMLLAVDEEGGTVTRISRYPAFRSQRFPSPREAFAGGGLTQALSNEEEICQLLQSLGINVNLGPVCDISEDPNAFMYQRSLGQDAAATGDFVAGTVKLMNAYQIGSVLKHFPGYGNNADTHTGLAVDGRSLQALESSDLLPFAAGIEAGCGAVLVSHNIVQALDRDSPASLSPAVHRYLRDTMGFDGVVMTDDLVMEAITDRYGTGEAAVLAVQAGNDLLCSTDYAEQYSAVLSAVLDGRIDFDA